MYKVMIHPNVYGPQEVFELGSWSWRWVAWFQAWRYAQKNLSAIAYIKEAK